jgi:hypothetical protein
MKKLETRTQTKVAFLTTLLCAAALSLAACGGEELRQEDLVDTSACTMSSSEQEAMMECPDSLFASMDPAAKASTPGVMTQALMTFCPAKTRDNILYCWCLYSWRGGVCSYHDCPC